MIVRPTMMMRRESRMMRGESRMMRGESRMMRGESRADVDPRGARGRSAFRLCVPFVAC
jgi:hypothetical protein